MQQVTSNVFVETRFHGCNTGFVATSRGVVVIDTPMMPEDARNWRREAEKYGPVRYVINTEPHADHASSNYWFDAPVIAHEGTRQNMAKIGLDEYIKMLQRNSPQNLPLEPDYYFRLPEITFSQNLTFYLGEHTFHLLNLPGHTAGETTVYVPEEKVAFTGDNLNLATPIFIQSQPDKWLTSLKQLEQLDVNQWVPGHGEVSDKGCIGLMTDAVQAWMGAVRSAMDEGMDAEQVIAMMARKKNPGDKDPFLERVIRMNVTDLFRFFSSIKSS